MIADLTNFHARGFQQIAPATNIAMNASVYVSLAVDEPWWETDYAPSCVDNMNLLQFATLYWVGLHKLSTLHDCGIGYILQALIFLQS